MDGQVTYRDQKPKIYELYSANEVLRLRRLLYADSWLLEHDKKCQLLTPEESQVLENRIQLIKSMLDILQATR